MTYRDLKVLKKRNLAEEYNKICIIISQSSWLNEFITVLRAEGWQIKAVYTDVYASIMHNDKEILCYPLHKALCDIDKTQVNYVFSIVNPIILPQRILQKSICVNFHPALLPKYAGVCPVNWAIFQSEKTHGYTWHFCSEKIDQGAILFQSKIPVLPNDNAKKLMLKCYKKAVDEFSHVLEILLDSKFCLRETDSIEYYGYNRKPNFLLTDFEDYASCKRLLNASESMDSYNDFGVVKILLGKHFYILDVLNKAFNTSKQADDSIIYWNGQKYYAQLRSLYGDSVIENAVLSDIESTYIQNYFTHVDKLGKYEYYWLGLLRNFMSPKLFSYVNYAYKNVNNRLSFQCDFLNEIDLPYNKKELIFALWCCIILKITNYQTSTIWLTHNYAINEKLQPLFYPYIPFLLKEIEHASILEFIQFFIEKKNKIRDKYFFLTDLFARDFVLKEEKEQFSSFSFSFSYANSIACQNHPVIFYYDQNNNMMYVDCFLPENSFLTKALAQFETYFNILTSYHLNSKLNEISLNNRIKTQAFDMNRVLMQNTKYQKRLEQLVKDNAYAQPNHTIVVQNDRQYTYKTLVNDVLHLSQALSFYIPASTIIGLIVPRGYVFIKNMLAILENKSAYLPIFHEMNEAVMLDLMLEIGTYGFITDRMVEDDRVASKIKIDSNCFFYIFKQKEKVRYLSDNVAYVMFTSGSTGKPKGIPIKHSNIINLCETDFIRGITKNKKVMHNSQVSFDAATFEIWGSLLNTSTICILENCYLMREKAYVFDFCKKYSINTMWMSTKLFESYLTDMALLSRSELEYLVYGGESCNVSLIKKFSSSCPLKLIHVYGPTENTVFSTIHEWKHDDESFYNDYPNIGKPLKNVEVEVYDKYFNTMPYYVPEKLFLSGLSLFEGYLNAPNTTISSQDNRDVYNSGDICYLDGKGDLHIIGRDDKLVKLNGYRIELRHVESILAINPAVTSCKAEVFKMDNGQQYLVAFIISDNINQDEYEKSIRHTLPKYMIPSYYLYLDKWPLTRNGKLDSKALVERFNTHITQYHKQKLICSNTLSLDNIITLFQKVLPSKHIALDGDFFDLGGDSLCLVYLKTEVKKSFDFDLSLVQFLEAPTPRGLYGLLTDENSTSNYNVTDYILKRFNEYKKEIDESVVTDSFDMEVSCKNILLTGATGFLGSEVLRYLCQYKKNTQVYCLIRAKGQAFDVRVNELLQSLKLGQVNFSNIHFINGDLEKFQFGLSDDDYHNLACKVTSIIHCACYVHHLYSYKQLEQANVFSTLELIKFAFLGVRKMIVYTSSISAVVPKDVSQTIYEKVYTDIHDLALANGYNQTKYVSELLLNYAHQKGMACIIVRPGWIVGNSQSGYFITENDHYSMILRSVLSFGYAPEFNFNINFIPVDTLSELLVKLSNQRKENNKKMQIMNLKNSKPLAWQRLLKFLNMRKRKVIYDTGQWYQALLNTDEKSPLFVLKSLYESADKLRLLSKYHIMKIDTTTCKDWMRQCGMTFPRLGSKIMMNLFQAIVPESTNTPKPFMLTNWWQIIDDFLNTAKIKVIKILRKNKIISIVGPLILTSLLIYIFDFLSIVILE